jgi:hypothetical protein
MNIEHRTRNKEQGSTKCRREYKCKFSPRRLSRGATHGGAEERQAIINLWTKGPITIFGNVRKELFILVLVSVSVSCEAQEAVNYTLPTDTIHVPKYVLKFKSKDFKISAEYTKSTAKSDIAKNKIVILFSGGFGGMPDFDNPKDFYFQLKYNVKFFSQGCSRHPDDDQKAYNKEIFKFLDSKYGLGWRKDIRPGAEGME